MLSGSAPHSPRQPWLFTCRHCLPGQPRSVEPKFYRSEQSGTPADCTYDRAHLLAVRERVRGGANSDIAQAIRRSLPTRLTHLVRRRRGRRAGAHTHRPIRAICGSDSRPRPPTATRAAGYQQPTITVPARLSISETRRVLGSGKQLVPAIFLTNPTSLSNKLDELYANMMQYAPDVVCISEVWRVDEDKARLPGFSFFQRPRPHRRGGGVGCYVRHSIPVKLLNTLQPSEEDCRSVVASNTANTASGRFIQHLHRHSLLPTRLMCKSPCKIRRAPSVRH